MSYAEPPTRHLKQTKKCDPTPLSDVFTTDDLEKIVEKASDLSTHKFQASSLPKFVSMHKIFLVACAICLFHSDGICATIAASRLLDDGQITIDNLKSIDLSTDCLQKYKKKSSVDGYNSDGNSNDVSSLEKDMDMMTFFCSLLFCLHILRSLTLFLSLIHI